MSTPCVPPASTLRSTPLTTPAAVAPVGRGGATRTVADGVAPQRRPQSTLREYSEYRREHSESQCEYSEYPAGRRECGRRRATARRGALQQRRRAARAGARTRRARGATLGTHVGTLTTQGTHMGTVGTPAGVVFSERRGREGAGLHVRACADGLRSSFLGPEDG